MFSWASATASVEYVKAFFSGKYYVEQQLAKMQVHRLNKDKLIEKASGRSKLIVQSICDEYDKLIQAEKWRWIKRGNKLECLRHENGNVIGKGKKYGICKDKNKHHDGIFPPLGAIAETMEECNSNVEGDNATVGDVTDTLKAWTNTYFSYLEYWVLQLEALELDMAVTLKT